MFISSIKTAFQLLANRIKRIYALGRNGILYLKQYGLRAFVTRARERLKTRSDNKTYARSTNANVHNIYMEIYKTLVNTAASRDNSDYVPIAQPEFPIELAPIKLVAFYLPQFHPIPENDEWWGRGFTEWTNVSKAVPQFVGHYQPHLPGELGFYDLRVPEVQKRQIELARKYGIHGFAFYYYWFNGKRLLEKPMDIFFADKENKFPFCIFWANENWTRRWDGKDEDILIAQNHSPASDLAFIQDIEPYLRDKRYIRIDGKPVLLVYRVQLFPNPAETAGRWREYCRKAGIGEIYLIAGQVYGFEDPRAAGFDAAVEFPPHNLNIERINDSVQLSNPAHDGPIFHYRDFANFYSHKKMEPEYELFKTVAPNWDNEPRKPGKGYSIAFSTPHLYQQWLIDACKYTLINKAPEQRFVFVNAWNEWGEGAYLEPDRRFGYAYLQATINALNALKDQLKAPILIFQMSKVGSTSVTNTLSSMNLGVPIYNLHILNQLDVIHENIVKRNINPKDSLSVIERGRKVRERIDSDNYLSWNIISMVRDPVARNVSVFFQQLKETIPNVEERINTNSITAEELLEIFLNRRYLDSADQWFDTQLKPVFQFDIFAAPFNKDQGYEIYEGPRFRLLMMRLENMNDIIQPAMKRFFGIENFRLLTQNVGREKNYGKVYSEFLTFSLPLSYVQEVYSTRTATHFYTKEEIERFTDYWINK